MKTNDANAAIAPGVDLMRSFPGPYGTILADPPWRFTNRTGKMAPEHRRLSRYATMTFDEIMELPVAQLASEQSHLYLWVPNALIGQGLEVMRRWGFTYKTSMVWVKDKIGMGYYWRSKHEFLLLGVKGKGIGTPAPADRKPSVLEAPRVEHSKKPDVYGMIEKMYPGRRYLELFARNKRKGWKSWGNEI